MVKRNNNINFKEDKYPVMKKTSETHTEVKNSVIIHGVNCVELEITQIDEADKNNISRFSFFERLTDTHLQTVASLYNCKNNVKKFHTFLDSDFNDVWGYGDDNCGVELDLKPKGLIISDNSGALTAKNKDLNTLDIVGRFTVFIGDKSYDTVREIFYDTSDELVENYIAEDGRVILFRRFNKYDWNVGKDKPYKVLWTEQLPESDRLTLNSDIYVHWYNSIPEYAL